VVTVKKKKKKKIVETALLYVVKPTAAAIQSVMFYTYIVIVLYTFVLRGGVDITSKLKEITGFKRTVSLI